MGMIMHDDVPYGEGTSYTQGTGIAINNNVIAVDADNTPTSGSEKPVKSKGVYEVVEQIYADNGVLGAKNLLKKTSNTNTTVENITFTVNADNSITCNGTSSNSLVWIIESVLCKANKEYILTGCPSGGGSESTNYWLGAYVNRTLDKRDTGNGVLLKYDSDTTVEVRLRIPNGYTANNFTFYPMLRLASDPDDTYVPYAPTNAKLNEEKMSYADNGVLGAKNLMHYPYNELKTSVDVTLTVDSDGVINLNGTQGSSAQGQYYLSRRFNYDFQLPAGTYKLTGGFSDAWLDIGVNNVTGDASQGSTTLGQDRGNGFTFTLTKLSDIQVILFIDKNKTFSNKKIYPMIRLASDPDDTYVPYAMTNREITEELTVQESAVTDIISGVVDNVIGNHLYKYGKVVTLSIRLNNCTMSEWGDPPVFKIPSGYRPISTQRVTDIFDSDITARAKRSLQISPDGNALCSKAITDGMVCFYATWITQ